MSPRPPTSTLFPYTTLFRSEHLHEERPDHAGGEEEGSDRGADELVHREKPRLQAGVADAEVAAVDEHRQQGADRKSTRLNSSHMSISYAVFCLKKKKKTREA